MSASTKKQNMARPPVVAILGHIDHGKSTLLDYIRKSNIVDNEAGGITQHVHAYAITHKTRDGDTREMTFIDTPGHAAFSSSRKRSAHIADIGIIIISAEEGVKEQTKESIKMATDTKVPFIIAINKIDRPNANIDKVKQDLIESGVYVEGYGGTIPVAPISAKTGEGIEDLLDIIVLMADMEEFTKNDSKEATGFVLESFVDKKVGTIASLIIKDGTLYTGDFIVNGEKISKIKKIESFDGKTITSASASLPVNIYGLSEIAVAGEPFLTFKIKKDGEVFIKNLKKDVTVGKGETENNEKDERVIFPIVLKTDMIGTLEALKKEIAACDTEDMRIKLLSASVGSIGEKDIKLAGSAKNPVVIGFNVSPDNAATDFAEHAKIPIETFNVIYRVLEYLTDEIKKRTPKKIEEKLLGTAKVIRLFNATKRKQVIGAKVIDGSIEKNSRIKLIRNTHEIDSGNINELQIERVPVKLAEKGSQFGATIDMKHGIALGDELQAFTTIEK